MGEPTLNRGSRGGVAIAAVVLVAVSVACGGGERSIAGEWSGEDSDGNRMTFVFGEGGEAEWIVQASGMARPETIGMRYDVDAAPSPHHIDLSGFREGPLEGVTMVGIYEFTGDDAFRIDLEPVVGAVDPDSARPDEFTEQTVTFTRGGGSETGGGAE